LINKIQSMLLINNENEHDGYANSDEKPASNIIEHALKISDDVLINKAMTYLSKQEI